MFGPDDIRLEIGPLRNDRAPNVLVRQLEYLGESPRSFPNLSKVKCMQHLVVCSGILDHKQFRFVHHRLIFPSDPATPSNSHE